MQKLIFEKLLKDKSIQNIIENKDKKSFQVTGLNETAEMTLLNLYTQDKSTLLVISDELIARECLHIWQAVSDLPAYILTPRELIFTDVLAVSREIELQRLAILQKLFSGEKALFIVPAIGLLDYYPDKTFFAENTLNFVFGEEYDFKSLQDRLSSIGYERMSQIESAGQYAVRGDIMDIGIPDASSVTDVLGIRLSFFDTELESIRSFDIDTQRSLTSLKEIDIPPAKEWLISKEQASSLANKIQEATKDQSQEALKQGADLEIAHAFERLGKRDSTRIEQGMNLAALDRWHFLLENPKYSLLELVRSTQTNLAFSEILQIQKRLDAATLNFHEQMKTYLAQAQIVKDSIKVRLTSSEAWQGVTELPTLTFAQIDSTGNGISGAEKIQFSLTPVDSYRIRENEFLKDWRDWTDTQTEVIIFSGSKNRAEKLESLKEDHNLDAKISEKNLSKGFVWNSIGLVLIGTEELFGAKRKKTKR